MSNEKLSAFIEEKINSFAKNIISKGDASDEVAVGERLFYTTLKSAMNGKAGKKEPGMLDAINDTLQYPGKAESGTTFHK